MRRSTSMRLLFVLAAAPVIALAQGTTTAAVTGVVRDPQGKPVAGATIRLSSPVLIGGERVMTTAENGSYRMPALPPGKYKIVVEASGFQSITGHETLELGRTSTLNWKFAPVGGATVEVVAAAANLMEATPSGVSTNVSMEQVEVLPVTRDLQGVMNLTPGVNGNAAWGGTERNNAYLMDGVNVGDPGYSSQWIFPNMDWFEEIQVGGIGAPAEVGNFTGGYVNAIIKRGGNEMAGGFTGYYNTTAWQDRYNYNHPAMSEETKKPGKGRNYDLGFHLGGPIVKDKLWYFASASKIQNENAVYGTSVMGKEESIKLLGKITWQANENGTFEAFGEYDTLDYEKKGLAADVQSIATWKQQSPSYSYSLSYTHRIGDNKVLTGKLMGYRGQFDMTSYNGTSPSLMLKEPYMGIVLFNNVDSEHLNNRERVCFSGLFDWFITSGQSNHALRMGVDIENAASDRVSTIPGGVRYEAQSNGSQVTTFRAIKGGGMNSHVDLLRNCAFLQDTWTLSERLTLAPGLRWESYKGKSGGIEYWSADTLAPRLGFTWALTENQQHVLKAHWGRYFESLSGDMFNIGVPGAFPDEVGYAWGNTTPIDPFDPGAWSQIPINESNILSTVKKQNVIASGVKHPYADALTLGYETVFSRIYKAGLTYINKKHKNAVVLKQGTQDTGSEGSLTNPLDGKEISFWKTSITGNDRLGVITNDGRSERKYDAITATFERAQSNQWNMAASLTWAKLKGNIEVVNGLDEVFYSPNNLLNAYGDLPGQNEFELKLRGGYSLPTNTHLTANLTHLSGECWTPVVYLYNLGPDGVTENGLKVAPRGSYKLDGRNLLDIRITQNVDFGPKVKLEAYVEVRNLLNEGNPSVIDNVINFVDAATLSPNSNIGIQSGYKYPKGYETPRNFRVGMRLKF